MLYRTEPAILAFNELLRYLAGPGLVFVVARQNAVQLHQIPQLSIPTSLSANADLPGIRRTLSATRHLLEMYRRQLQDETARRKLQHLDKRLLNVVFELDRFTEAQK